MYRLQWVWRLWLPTESEQCPMSSGGSVGLIADEHVGYCPGMYVHTLRKCGA